MVIIKLRNGADWHKANWVFRWLTDDAGALTPDDASMVQAMQIGGWHGMLALDTMDEEMAARITTAMRAVAQDVADSGLRNMTPERERDLDAQKMYRESMVELLDRIDNGPAPSEQ